MRTADRSGLRFALAIALSFAMPCVHAQHADCYVFGAVMDAVTREPLRGSAVEAIDLKWGRRLEALAGDSGRYALDLGRNGEWQVTYAAPGYVAKRLRILLVGIPPEDWAGGFGMQVDMTMLPEVAGVDYGLFDEPFGIARYNADSARLEWDMAHTGRMRERQRQLLEALAPTAR